MDDDTVQVATPTPAAPDMLPFDAYQCMLDGSWPQRVADEGEAA